MMHEAGTGCKQGQADRLFLPGAESLAPRYSSDILRASRPEQIVFISNKTAGCDSAFGVSL